MTKAKILTLVGARPQFIKAAPLSRAIREHEHLDEVLIHTGQHFDAGMSDVFFDELGIPAPDHHLEIHGGNHGDMTGRMMQAVEPVMLAEAPDVVLVYGDTNTTLAGALVASKLSIPIAHVEAGLRSFNRAMPEEINRLLTDHVSSLLFCPTPAAVEHLSAEGITEGVYEVGDVMMDATLQARERAVGRSTILDDLNLDGIEYAVATVHRAENTDSRERLEAVISWLERQASEQSVILPLHPRTRSALARYGISFESVRTIEPVGYLDMVQLLRSCTAVYTDSGGLQKEAYFHGKPCVTLRDETEWTETIDHGWNRLWTQSDYQSRHAITCYGDGHTSSSITDVLTDFCTTHSVG